MPRQNHAILQQIIRDKTDKVVVVQKKVELPRPKFQKVEGSKDPTTIKVAISNL